jgi:predicted TIM-barrel fold metal-dependent hydrolase
MLPDYLSMLATLGVERSVLVQPSVYGTDNSALLEALARAPMRTRGVLVLEDSVSDYELRRLDEAGVRGVRINLVDRRDPGGPLPIEALRRAARRVRTLGWHLELLLHIDDYPDLDRQLRSIPADMVLAHLGFPRPGHAVDNPGFQQLLRLLDRGNTWVKLTAPYRLSSEEYPYQDIDPLVAVLRERAPQRLLWGSDWPHVRHDGKMPNDGDLCDLLLSWLPDPAIRERVLVDNPAALYRF